MTKRKLIYIKTIIEEGSISKAANKLFLTQPSLSKCVQNIETTLGTKLFRRTSTGLIPTLAGERYYQVATQILRIYNDFEIEISDINKLKKGRVTIGCTIYLATYILPVIIPMFKQECPNIELYIVERNSTELEKDLSEGKVDFAIMHTSPVYKASKISNINFYPLCKDPFLLVTKQGHPLSKYAVNVANSNYPKIDLTLFANEHFILVKRNQRIRQVSELIFQKANINPTIVFTTKSFEIARRLACEGIGVTFVSEQYSQIFPGIYKPAYYSIDKKYSPYWTMCVAVQKDAYISNAAKFFIKLLSQEFGSNTLDL
jgi:DNA-binding transcriptional LysR family regulator